MKNREPEFHEKQYASRAGVNAIVQTTDAESVGSKLTVVIPALGNTPYLAAAIESALYAPAVEVLIADDACGAAERRVFARFEARHGDRVRVIRSNTRRGIASNVNEAVRHVRTPYFVRLDCDDVLYPGHVQTAVRMLSERPSLAVVAGRESRITAQDCLKFRPELLGGYEPDPNPRILSGPEAFRFTVSWDPNPCSSGTVYRTEAFRDVGCFDPSVPWGEDWEIWLRFAQRWEVAYLASPSALYRIHADATTSIFTRQNRLCYGYDFIFRRAAELCKHPEFVPQLRRAFLRVARLYAGAASREVRRLRWESIVCCHHAVRALITAAFIVPDPL